MIDIGRLPIFCGPAGGATPFTPVDPGTTGLMGYYKLDANANDSSGNGRNGIPTGATYGAPAKLGAGALTAGSVAIADTGFSPLATEWTVCGWLMTNTDSSPDDPGNSVSGVAVILFQVFSLGGSGQRIVFPSGLTSASNLDNSTYYHCVATYSGGNVTAFLNGVSLGSAALALPDLSTIIITAEGVAFTAPIDEAPVYNRALSAAEIAFLYNGGAGQRPGGLA